MQTLLLVATLVVGLAAAEVVLRLTWTDPRDQRPVGQDYKLYVRLQAPNQNLSTDLTGLYAGAGVVKFRTDADGAILGRRNPGLPLAFFYGGSTTENGVVSEGQRWVEQIQGVDARNFGLAHNNLINDYANFKYHLETGQRPSEAFFMEAANDLIFSAMTPGALNSRPKKQGSRFRIYLYDLVQTTLNSVRISSAPMRDYWRGDPYLLEQKRLPTLPDAAFEQYAAAILTPTLQRREQTIGNIVALGRRYHVKITFLTQPNSYRRDFRPFEGVDMRTYPRLNGKMFTLEQSAALVEMTNQSTVRTAIADGASAIDVAGAFESQDPGPLFYDSFHYTPAGSRFFASVVNQARAGPAAPAASR
jgi:hypothetical protein